nr:FxSxx-COOH system tetratricopeptide repeat protein [Streptomyces sp. SID13726]
MHPREIADALWLASEHAWLAGASDGPDPDSVAESGSSASEAAPDERTTDRASATEGRGPEPDLPEPAPVGTGETAQHRADGVAPGPERVGARAYEVVSRTSSPPGDRALGRALRAFRTTVASAHTSELDEEATAELLAPAPFLPPVLRPTPERRWRAVLLVDSAPRMALWQDTAARFARIVRAFGGFRDVTELSLDTAQAGQATVRLPGSATGSRSAAPRGLVDPTGRSVVFVLTDGLAPAWRSGAAQRLLALWGRRQPVAVLHMLPQRLWHRTGLHPSRVALRASGPWTPGRQPAWEPAEALSALLGRRAARGAAVPVPVLEGRPEWLEPWARFVGGEQPREVELAAVFASPTGPEPVPSAPRSDSGSEPEPAVRVATFRGWASPDAFRLATRLAAVPLGLGGVTEVQQCVLPGSDPQHLAELLLSDLLTLRPPGSRGRLAYAFVDGVREELLAYGSRTATERVIERAAEILAPTNSAARSLLSYLRGEAATVAPAPDTDQEFRSVERAVLHALSGPHARRARQLDALENTGSVRTAGRTAVAAEPDEADDHPYDTARSRLVYSIGPLEQHTVVAADTARADPGENHMSVTVPHGRPAESDRNRTRPMVWGNVPPRNASFTGREELLEALEESLLANPVTAALPQALHGMGGIGKSQLALEYVYRYATNYDLVWWIPAEQPALIRQAFVELAERLQVSVSSMASTAIPAVLEALRTGIPYGNWLLVFDNADSPEAIQDCFPSRFEGGPAGAVLVTSRNPQWNALAHPLEVGVFERHESVALLRRRNPDVTDDEAELLAETLGDLPLAVEQASAWRAETGMSPKEYVRLFEEISAELMHTSSATQYGDTIASAWGVSLGRLEERSPAALRLLELCSYLAPKPVPRHLFAQRTGERIDPDLDRVLGDPLQFARALREINRYSLARIDHRTDTITLHRLVQALLRSRMSEEQRVRYRHGAHLLLAGSWTGELHDPRNWPRFAQLYPHVLASQAVESDHRATRRLVLSVISYLLAREDHTSARDLAERTYALWRERFGDGDPQTLTLGVLLHMALRRTGRYSEASALGDRLLSMAEAAGLQEEDEEVYLSLRMQVAGDIRSRGDFRGALEVNEDIHARALRQFGPEDPLTLGCAADLAMCLRLNGDYRRALKLDEETLRRREELLGQGDPLCLSARSAIAAGHRELGRHRKAVHLYVDLLEQTRDLYGADHPKTLMCLARLAAAQRRAGLHDEAAANSRTALTALTARYGNRDPEVLRAALTRSLTLRDNGELDAARSLGERVREQYAQQLGEHHPVTLSAGVDLAVTLRWLGEIDAARQIDEAALERFRETLGDTHPRTLVASMTLANDLFAQEDVGGAHTLDDWALDAMRETLGGSHPTTLVLRTHIAMDLRALGQDDEAAALHSVALGELRERLGPDHSTYVKAAAWRRVDCDLGPMPI